MKYRILIVSAFCLISSQNAIAAPTLAITCAPSPDLERAKSLRVSSHRPDQARDIAKNVLDKDPSNLRAKYTLGLSLIDLSIKNPDKPPDKTSANFIQGMAELVAVSNALEAGLARAPSSVQQCLKGQGVLTVNNSLGDYYLKVNDLGNAEIYLRRGEKFDQQDVLSKKSHALLNANLGHLYYALGNDGLAQKYLGEAQKSGNNNSLVGSQLRALAVIHPTTKSRP